MKPLYKILTPDELIQVQTLISEKSLEWAGTAFDINDGFIHLATAAQTPVVANRFFNTFTTLHLLVLKPELEGLKWEAPASPDQTLQALETKEWLESQEHHPHVYARINLLDDVLRIVSYDAVDGVFPLVGN